MTDTASRSWYEVGYPTSMGSRDSGPARLLIKPGESKVITFIDSIPAGVRSHLVKYGERWLDVTCDSGACCRHFRGISRYNGYFTVVEDAPWKSRVTEEMQNFAVKLLKVPLDTLPMMKELGRENGLAGLTFTALRSGKDAPICGDEFVPKETVDMGELFKKATYKLRPLREMFAEAAERPESLEELKAIFDVVVGAEGIIEKKLVPFNYREILKPRTEKEIRESLESSKSAV